MQRESEPAPAAAAVPETAPTAADTGVDAATSSAAPAAATVGAAATSPTSPEELDKLAARLVEPLTRRIKAEMIIDRERRGLRSDPR